MSAHFILASQSPRRRELFGLLGYPFEIMTPDVDEDVHLNAGPAAYVLRTARQKAEAVTVALSPAPEGIRRLIVAADTTVALEGDILAKPGDGDEARAMLLALRGRTHEVHTGVCVVDADAGRELSAVSTAAVTMRDYSDAEIAAYIATGDPFDKAGGYAIQHPDFRPVAALSGCFLAVVGLSLCDLIPCSANLTCLTASARPRWWTRTGALPTLPSTTDPDPNRIEVPNERGARQCKKMLCPHQALAAGRRYGTMFDIILQEHERV